MKRFLFMLLCSVLTLSYTASGSASQLIKANVEKVAEDKDVINETAFEARRVIGLWMHNRGGFRHDDLNPYVLEKNVDSATDALGIVHRTLLNQSGYFIKEDNDSKICTYESDKLRVYYTELGFDKLYARAVVIINLNENPEVYILVFKKAPKYF